MRAVLKKVVRGAVTVEILAIKPPRMTPNQQRQVLPASHQGVLGVSELGVHVFLRAEAAVHWERTRENITREHTDSLIYFHRSYQ